MRRGAALALAVLCTFGTTPALGVSSEASSRAERAAIQELLDRRARAIRARDRAAFLATVAPSSRSFLRRQERFFRGLGSLPLESYRLRAAWDRYGDLADPSLARRYAEVEAIALPLTEERYVLAGFDEAPALEDMFYTFVRSDGEWLIADDNDLDAVGLFSARHLWDAGPLEAARSEHFLVYRHSCGSAQGCAPMGRGLLAEAEAALDVVKRHWKPRWNQNVLMLLPTTQEELGRMVQATVNLDNFVALAYFSEERSHGLDYSGDRVMLNPRSFSGRASSAARDILAHELLHVATRDVAGPFIPIFVEEGIAEYVAGDTQPRGQDYLGSIARGGGFDRKLPRDFEFLTGSGSEIYLAYVEAASAVKFFIDRYGIQRFVHFYRRLGRPEVAPGTVRHHVGRALRASVGIGYADFETAWADSIGS